MSKSEQTTLHQRINAAFIKELEAFKRDGYKFNGTGKALFPGTQHEAFDAYLKGIKNDHTEGYFEIPTGVGKTALFIAIIGCYLRASESIPDAPRVLIHEPTNDLVTQTARAFADFMPDIASRIETDDEQGNEIDWQGSSVGAKHKGARDKSKKIVITTYQGQAADERKIEEADLLIGQARKLCRHIGKLDSKPKQQACDSINALFKASLEEPIATDAIRQSAVPLAKLIEEQFSDDPHMTEFLEAVRSKRGKPLEDYKPTPEKDKKEAIKNRTYKPEEFGLVIHDEAHYLTGEKFGPAAVDKFHGSTQLGVTATPEYSVNKTVANKLAHCYYHLPLTNIEKDGKVIQEGAIERGDLCHVRPVLIKTHINPKIDLVKAREYFATQKGKPLSNLQLQQLLNQEARNKAIIKAYLTGTYPAPDDPDDLEVGERFLGKTGMIFAGGITHCRDFVRDAYKVLDQANYREVKNWLRDEGLCLIAPVHSEVPKDGIDIVIGGKKRRCSKDEIKELHRQGKILLLISDKELNLGTDFPRDSFIADAVDRFSVPDAAQRMGRGFRVDDRERDLPLEERTKSCAVLNVIDESTHDMYEGTPHYPIHAIEILHGVEHRPPGRRKGALTRYRSQPPEVTEGIEELGFEFITRTEAVRGVSEKFKKGKKKVLPDKTDDDLTLKDEVPAELKIGRNNPQYVAWRTQVEAKLDAGETVEVGGYPILQMQSEGNRPYCLNCRAIPALAKELNIRLTGKLPDKKRDDLTLSREVPEALKTSPKNPQYLAWRTPTEAKLDAGKKVEIGGYPVLKMQVKKGRHKPYCLHRNAIPALAEEVNVKFIAELPKKTPNDLSLAKEVPAALKIGFQNPKYTAWRTRTETKLDRGETVEVGGYTIIKMQAGESGQKPYCLNISAIPALAEELNITITGELPQKTPHDLTLGEELPTALDTYPKHPQYATWRKQVEAKLDTGKTVKFGGYPVLRMQSGSNKPYCLSELAVPAVRKELAKIEISHADESLKSKPFAPRSLKPDSDDLKRTGRSRARAGNNDDE